MGEIKRSPGAAGGRQTGAVVNAQDGCQSIAEKAPVQGAGIAEAFARAMARRDHELVIERQALDGIAPPPPAERERYLQRAEERAWPLYWELAAAVVFYLDSATKRTRAA